MVRAHPSLAPMFRDSRGVVHTVSSADPLLDLPADAAAVLQRGLLVPVEGDLGGALERCEAARELIERWQDAFFASLPDDVDLREEARWAAEAGLSLDDVESGYDEDDEPVPPVDLEALAPLEDEPSALLNEPSGQDAGEPTVVLPEELVAALERELLLLPTRVRLEALVSAADLVDSWADLLADHEKVLGHLVLGHGEPQQVRAHEALADRHAALHAAGPGH